MKLTPRFLCSSLVLGFCACNPAGTSTDTAKASASPSPTAQPTPSAELRAALAAFVADPKTPLVTSKVDRAALTGIYPPGAEAPLWLGPGLLPTETATAALALLSDAAAEGLDPAIYAAPMLTAKAAMLAAGAAIPEESASFDVSLSLSMMRYLRQFHQGRVNPRDIGFLVSLPEDEHDFASLVREAATRSRLKEVVDTVTPSLMQYRALRAMLPKYRALAQSDGTSLPRMGKAPARSIKPGATAPAALLEVLRARLIAMSDMPETTAAPTNPTIYEGEIVEGVKRFQFRHGFEADGVLGKSTWAALSVPLSWRLRQIELAMERMRWLPELGARSFVAVNVPMFRLFAWDKVPESGIPDFEMGAIVGKALDTRTPVFLDEMTHIIFQPYWNVPKSILEGEILPKLHRDLGYLAREDMEIVDGQSDNAEVMAATSENVDRLARGELRLRQRPGRQNALGQVKFMFPNVENIYLHSTPAPELFDRARRDFSHGCVRVEDPVALAVWALKDQPEWTREKIVAAMSGEPSLKVNLRKPVRVVLYYVTATVMPETRNIHFSEDIYKHDPILDKALKARLR